MAPEFDLVAFRAALRDLATGHELNPDLAASPAGIVKQAYELWLSERQAVQKRTLERFDEALKREGVQAKSLWRKVKGILHPSADELRGVLKVTLGSDAEYLDSVANLILEQRATVVAAPRAGLVVASVSGVVLGPDQAWLVDEFRRLHGTRLSKMQNEVSAEGPIPLTVWVIWGGGVARPGEEGYRSRTALLQLAGALMATLGTPLYAPLEAPNLRVGQSEAASPRVRLSIEPGGATRRPPLGELLIKTSLICIGGASFGASSPDPALSIVADGGEDPSVAIAKQLMPEALITLGNARAVLEDSQSARRLTQHLRNQSIALGTKLSLADIFKISALASLPMSANPSLAIEAPSIQMADFVYWFDSSPDYNGVREEKLNVAPGGDRQNAMWWLMAAGCYKLRNWFGKEAPPSDSVGAALLGALEAGGMKLMTVPEFLKLGWFQELLPDDLPDLWEAKWQTEEH